MVVIDANYARGRRGYAKPKADQREQEELERRAAAEALIIDAEYEELEQTRELPAPWRRWLEKVE